MNKKIERLLENQDWPCLYEKLLMYANSKTEKHRWNCENKTSLEDMVHSAIESLLDGKRNWNPKRVDIACLLRGVIDSKQSHLLNSWEEKNHISIYDLPSDDWGEKNEFFPESNLVWVQSPETIPIEKERQTAAQAILKRIKGSIKKDTKLKEVLECMSGGTYKPSKIAKATHIPIERVYELHRKLKNKSKNIAEGFLGDILYGEFHKS
ncbi:MAG: hypothetical protein A3I11_07250 [Elusimicrobia bacterium RIFCSPLOWO2_02_FULL_39_32]|nr:MAG: hypothetical protein A2034_07780 [Elusimicrobia bacterium GWA2_38_7]OGR81451.1 MAG: hypothetical protein A3B80_05375 [Elusimicrobia bacterium RIFCSPHIGHO2_02_FULL_39_36]OGR91981.1 MAG: hypothetical protein A3I11_07250 [Elusimicrobia bacterium RIFCSPLOWO2_02_FULL_39_32]OGR98727.1 MAG: hypothetical protein A3G85_05180 [Elusimicrobia bacterium RIFCSPLOWO2_12_FULL_39_28]